MRNIRWLAVIAGILWMVCAAGCSIPKAVQVPPSAPYTVVDSEGTRVTLPRKPEKILTGNLAYDTMVLGLVRADHLVAVNTLDHDPMMSFITEETKDIQLTVPSSMGIPLEVVIRTKPDVIITSDWMDKNTIEMLRGLGYPVIVCRGPDNFEDIRRDIALIAEALQEEEKGTAILADMDRDLAEVDEKLRTLGRPAPSAMLVSRMQSYGGPGSMYHELLTRAGIRNSIAEAGLKNGEPLSKEAILKADPDFFLVSADRERDKVQGPKFRKEFLSDPALQSLPGIHRVVPVPDRYIYCASQNAGYAVKALANAAYGPLFDLSDEHNISAAE